MAKIDKITELIKRYKEEVEKYKELLAEHATTVSKEEKIVWITRKNDFDQFIKELEELKKYYDKK